MKSLLIGALAVVTAFVAMSPSSVQACSPAMAPGEVRTYATEIFVGRVLERTALESRVEGTEHVTLYKLTVHVDDALKGSAVSGELTTVYLVARTDFSDEIVEETTSSGLYLYDLPEAPAALTSYLFFARSFADGEYVLFENSSFHLEPASKQVIEQTRTMISQVYMY